MKITNQAKVINISKVLYLPAKMGIIIPFMVKRQMLRGLDIFFCGAVHEMAAIDVDGTRYPCHRFMPWVTNKPAPKENVNCQNAWKPESCAKCKLIPSCPTCAGYNWEINGDTGHRTIFHCESYKLEVIASCLLEWKRLRRKLKNINSMPDKEIVQAKSRLAAIEKFIENPVE